MWIVLAMLQHIHAFNQTKKRKMKKLFLIILVFTVVNSVKAQSIRYDTCSYMQQFAGEWRSLTGTDTIKIYLRFHRDYFADPFTVSDQLYGWLEYKKGSVIIESTYQHRFMNLPYNYEDLQDSLISIRVRTECSINPTKLRGYVVDIANARQEKNVRAIISADKNTIIWNQYHKEGIGAFGEPTGMTLPRTFVLTRQ